MLQMLKSVVSVDLLCHVESALNKYDCDPNVHWAASLVDVRSGLPLRQREFKHCLTDNGYSDRDRKMYLYDVLRTYKLHAVTALYPLPLGF
jgi:hypothetical protein